MIDYVLNYILYIKNLKYLHLVPFFSTTQYPFIILYKYKWLLCTEKQVKNAKLKDF